MPISKLTCPHCSHDGTAETSRPPLGSHGFNYLAEGTICREVQGVDDAGKLVLSGDARCEAPQGSGARIECRSCWRTFAVPEGLAWDLAPRPDSKEPAPPAPQAAPAPAAAAGQEEVVQDISRNLLALLRTMRQELESATAARLAGLETGLAALPGVAQQIAALQSDLAGLRAESAGQDRRLSALSEQYAEVRQQLSQQEAAAQARADSLAAALESQREAGGHLTARLAEIQGGQDAARLRLDAQAEVIRALHAAAQEQMTRREELKEAVQRLEQIAAGLGQMKPLPEGL